MKRSPPSPGDHTPLPRVIIALLGRRLPPDELEFFLGDLEEGTAEKRASSGAIRSQLWLIGETCLAIVQPRIAGRRPTIPSPRRDTRMKSFVDDLRFALRISARAPGMSILTIATLALGIGAATAIFGVVKPALLEPLPYPRPEQLVMLWERDAKGTPTNIGYLTFRDFERESTSIESAAAVSYWQPIISDATESERLNGQSVTQRYFHALGVSPMLGRDFVAEEDRNEANRVVILAHSLWQRRFASDSGIVGRAITMNGASYTVVGVLPADFENIVAPGTEIFRPLGYDASLRWACRTCRHLRVIVRVRDGLSAQAAENEMSSVSRAIVRQFPNDYSSSGVILQPLHEMATQSARPALLALVAAVSFVLLIACVNAANLLLGRALRRGPEFAVRTALGAGQARLVRLVVAESLVLAVVAGSLGTLLAFGAVKWLLQLAPQGVPRLANVGVDGTVLGFALLAALVTGIVASAAPALAIVRAPLHGVLKSGARGLASTVPHRLRGALVIAEVAIAVSLLAGATLLFRSLGHLMAVDTGFDPRNRLSMEVQVSGPRYQDSTAVWRFWTSTLDAVRQVPGVVSAGIVSQLPFGGNVDLYGIHLEDRPSANPELDPSALRYGASADYLTTMGIPLLRGRAIDATDGTSSPFVVVINRAMADALFPGADAIGRRLRTGGTSSPWRTIVGVVDNARHRGLDAAVEYQMYIPFLQWWEESGMTLTVRTSGPPASLTRGIRDAVRSVDRSVAITNVATMEELVDRSTAQRRFALSLFGAFALVALLLAAAGIYGVLSAGVVERFREIGIRSALGAPRQRILSMIVRQGLSLTAIGLVLGVVGAYSLSRVLSALLFEVRSTDPITLLIVAAILVTLAALACALPALRASRVDPVTALRE